MSTDRQRARRAGSKQLLAACPGIRVPTARLHFALSAAVRCCRRFLWPPLAPGDHALSAAHRPIRRWRSRIQRDGELFDWLAALTRNLGHPVTLRHAARTLLSATDLAVVVVRTSGGSRVRSRRGFACRRTASATRDIGARSPRASIFLGRTWVRRRCPVIARRSSWIQIDGCLRANRTRARVHSESPPSPIYVRAGLSGRAPTIGATMFPSRIGCRRYIPVRSLLPARSQIA